MFRLLVLTLILIRSSGVVAQQAVIDSLTLAYASAASDSARAAAAVQLSKAWMFASPDSARWYAETGYDLGLRIGDDRVLATAMNLEGVTYNIQANHARADSLFEQALILWRRLPDTLGIAKSLINLGISSHAQGYLERGLKYYLEAIPWSTSIRDTSTMAAVSLSLAMIHDELNQFDAAVGYYRKAIESYRNLRNDQGVGLCFLTIGRHYVKTAQADSALFYLKDAFFYMSDQNDHVRMGSVLSSMAEAYLMMGRDSDALNTIERAVSFHEQTDQKAMAEDLVMIARIRLKMGAVKEGYEAAMKAYELGRLSHSNVVRRDASGILAKWHADHGNYPLAYRYLKEYVVYQDSVIGRERALEVNRLLLARKEAENAALLKEKALSEAVALADRLTIQRQNTILVASLTTVAILIAGLWLLVRAYRRNQRTARLLAEQKQELQRQHSQLEVIHRIAEWVNTAIDLDGVVVTVVQSMHTMTKADSIEAWIHNMDEDTYSCYKSEGLAPSVDVLDPASIRQRFIEGCEEMEKSLYVCRDIARFNRLTGESIAGLVSQVIRISGGVRGVFVLRRHHEVFPSEDLEFLADLEDHILYAFTKAKLLDDLRKLNEKKNELLGFAAHDLRSPLAVIMGYAGFLKEKLDSDPETLKDVEKILAAVKRMNLIVNQVVDISAIESGKVRLEMDRVDLNYLLNEAYMFYQNAARQKSISLNFVRSPKPLMVKVDPNRMGEVVDNLVSNALKYTPTGGRIEMRCGQVDDQALFEVEDTGQGMTDKDLQLVFRSFTRLSAKPTGGEASTGLGLAIVKKIVDLHGGRVSVKSTHGHGTTFSVFLSAG